MANKQVYLLLGDVINSRGIKNRKRFERKLQAALQVVMNKYGNLFYMPVKNWKGIDEIAAVLMKAGSVYYIIDSINNNLAPEKMRFVLATGKIDILPKTKDVSLLDGKVFHDAAAKMLEMKKEKWLFGVASNDNPEYMALNTQINCLLLVKAGWTEKQRKIFYAWSENKNQDEVARKLKITQQSVSKTLKSISGTQVMALENNLITWADANFRS